MTMNPSLRKMVKHTRLFKALKNSLRTFMNEKDAEGVAEVMVALKEEGLLGLHLRKDGKVVVYSTFQSSEKTFEKMKKWLMNENTLGRLSDEGYCNLLRQISSLKKPEYVS